MSLHISCFWRVFGTLFVLMSCIPVAAGDCVPAQSEVFTIYFGVEPEELPNPDHPHTIPISHTDIEIPLLFSEWDIHVDVDLDGRVETEDAFFVLDQTHRRKLSSPPGFLGVGSNETFWYYTGAAPSPGFASTAMGQDEKDYLCLWDPNSPDHNANTDGYWLQVNMIDVRGPVDSYVSMWQETPFAVHFSSFENDITSDDVYYIPAGLHAHLRWAFTKPGLYEVDMQISTYYLCDDSLTTDLNDDCFVNMQDYAILSDYWLQTDCGDPNNCPELISLTDPNEIDTDDLVEMTDQWLLCGSPFDSECP